MAAEIAEAIKAEKVAGRCGARSPLKDNLSKVIAEYNKMTTIKRHRIESSRRALIYNMCLVLSWKSFQLLCVPSLSFVIPVSENAEAQKPTRADGSSTCSLRPVQA